MIDPTYNRPFRDPAIRPVAVLALAILLALILGTSALALVLA